MHVILTRSDIRFKLINYFFTTMLKKRQKLQTKMQRRKESKGMMDQESDGNTDGSEGKDAESLESRQTE